jgi:hypothetical protein
VNVDGDSNESSVPMKDAEFLDNLSKVRSVKVKVKVKLSLCFN